MIGPIGWPTGAGRLRSTTASHEKHLAQGAGSRTGKGVPAAAYMSVVESWRELPGGEIEFTMRRLRSADWRFYDKTRRGDTAAGLSFYACEHRAVAKTNGTVNDYGKRQVNGVSNARRCSDKKPCLGEAKSGRKRKHGGVRPTRG
jgi:hypothetical protein